MESPSVIVCSSPVDAGSQQISTIIIIKEVLSGYNRTFIKQFTGRPLQIIAIPEVTIAVIYHQSVRPVNNYSLHDRKILMSFVGDSIIIAAVDVG